MPSSVSKSRKTIARCEARAVEAMYLFKPLHGLRVDEERFSELCSALEALHQAWGEHDRVDRWVAHELSQLPGAIRAKAERLNPSPERLRMLQAHVEIVRLAHWRCLGIERTRFDEIAPQHWLGHFDLDSERRLEAEFLGKVRPSTRFEIYVVGPGGVVDEVFALRLAARAGLAYQERGELMSHGVVVAEQRHIDDLIDLAITQRQEEQGIHWTGLV